MNASFMYWTVSGGGGHDLLSLIPYLLRLHEIPGSHDVLEIDVTVRFRATEVPDIPGFQPSFLDDYNNTLPNKPKCSFYKTTKKLKIEYVSKFLPFSTPKQFVSNIKLVPQENKGCQKLEQFVREFRDAFSSLTTEIETKTDFKPNSILVSIDELLSNFPTTDEQLIEADEKQRELPYEDNEESFEPYVSKTLPKVIPVNHYPDYGYSKYMGTYGKASFPFGKRNQFWARVAAVFSNGNAEQAWEERKIWYAILHTFDSAGNHIETKTEKIGATADGESGVLDRAEKVMMSYIDSLDSVKYGNIAIRLFDVIVDGHKFGMLDSSSEEYGDQTSMEPGDLVFYPPWTGDYDT